MNPVTFIKKGISISFKKISITNMDSINFSFDINNRTDDYLKIDSMVFYVNKSYIQLPLYNHSLEDERTMDIMYNKAHPNMAQRIILPESMVRQKHIKIPPHAISDPINIKISLDSNERYILANIVNLFTQPITKTNYKKKRLRLAISMKYAANDKETSLYNSKNVSLWSELQVDE